MRVLAGLLLSAASLFAASPAHAADRVVVRFARSADSADRSAARATADASSPQSVPGLTGVQVVTVPEGDAAAAARALDRADGVVWAEPEHEFHVSLALPSSPSSASGEQWGLLNSGQSIAGQLGTAHVDGDFTPAWNRTTGAGQTIGVVDTGVDFSIADLAANRAGAYSFITGDSNPAPDPNGTEDTSHGTHVAGIAAASLGVHETGGDITGGAPSARILSLRALDGSGGGSTGDIARAFTFAATHGARIVNASLGAPIGWDDAVHDAIASHPSTLFVIAAGNDGTNEDGTPSDARDYPCTDPSPNLICVAAVENNGALANYSNYGATTVDVGAPGSAIYSYVLGGALEGWYGTSMATPYASAAAALAFAARPSATPSQVRAAMIASARRLPALVGRTASGGIIDAAALVARIAALPVPKPAPKPTPTPTPAPKVTPAPASPHLSLHKPRRHGRRIALSGRTARAFHGKVRVKLCAGRHCRTVQLRVRRGAFSSDLRPPRHGKIVVTAWVPAGSGFKAARVRRTVRYP